MLLGHLMEAYYLIVTVYYGTDTISVIDGAQYKDINIMVIYKALPYGPVKFS